MDFLSKIGQFGSSLLDNIRNALPTQTITQNYQPTPTNPPNVIGDAKNMKLTYGSVLNKNIVPVAQAAEPVPTSMPQQPTDSNFRYAFEQYPQDLNAAALSGRGPFHPQQPPQNISNLIRQYFPNEATQAAAVASNENAGYNPTVKDNVNKNGSPDRGLFQINRDSFNGLMQRQGNALRQYGINSFEDMKDPEKNIIVAKFIKEGSQQANPQTNGWGGWYGWQDNGFNLNNGYYSTDKRINYAQKKKGK